MDGPKSHGIGENTDPSLLRSVNSIANRNARLLAIQCIYALDSMGSTDVESILRDALQNLELFLPHLENPEQINKKYFLFIAKSAFEKKEGLYDKIGKYLDKDWSVARLGYLIRAILHLGAYEVCYNNTISKSILINEYIEISKAFNHSGEAKFVNSILDKILKEYNTIDSK